MNSRSFFRLLLEANARMLRRRFLAVRQESWLTVSVVVLFVACYWLAAYLVLRYGFVYLLTEYAGLGTVLIDRMLYLFFGFLFLMLILSNMIIGHSSLFKSQETQWMLTLPVKHANVFSWKLVETTVLAGWAFLFFSAPLVLAYGTARHASGWFYVNVFLLLLPFMMISSALGVLLVMVLTRYLRRRTFTLLLVGGAAVVLVLAVFSLRPTDMLGVQQESFVRLFQHSRLAVKPLLPSYWVATGMIAWGDHMHGRAAFFWLVLVSNALIVLLVCNTASGRLFYSGWSHHQSQAPFAFALVPLNKPMSALPRPLLDRLLYLVPWMDSPTRVLVLKDIRTFWRDTAQWSQFMIFFGLLGLHVLNVRGVTYDWNNEFWAASISFLNLGATSMTLATLTTRFVYPQFSLEGKRLWIVGMAPLGLKRVVLQKFWLSSSVSVAITLSLTLISSWMRKEPGWLALLLAATVVMMSVALCGIAVGTGALFPNFGSGSTANRRDDNPARIVSGFGGTFCFVVSLTYIIIAIGAEALPFWFYAPWMRGTTSAFGWAMVGAWLVVSLTSLAAVAVPMTLALKRVESLEL